MRSNLQHKLIVLLFGLSLIGCMTAEGKKTLDKLRQIAAETPVYPSLNQTNSNYVIKNSGGDLAFYYRSAANYDEVKSFYIKELTAKGWSDAKESTSAGGAKELEFRKGDYYISVFYSTHEREGWDYSINFGWDKP